MEPTFFATPADFRVWLEAHHESRDELWVGFHKKATGRPSITWPEAVDEALCFGWIDGLRRSFGPDSYVIRFTPRRARSIWSAVNVKRFGELQAAGRVHPSGERAFARRTDDRSGVYSYERRDAATLGPEDERRLRADAQAWTFFQAQAPWYQRAATHWVVSAKRQETRERRLAQLIEDSARGRTVPPLTRPDKRR